MKKHNTRRWQSIRSSILAVLLLAFTVAEAQLVITPTVTPACHSADGAVTFTLTGGNLSGTHYYYVYGYNGSNYPQQTSPTFTGLAAGGYQLYMTGADSGALTFTVPAQITISPSVTNTTCPTNAGSILITPSGGTPTYSYVWSNAATTQTISGLAGGLYSVSVTDANGCSASRDTISVIATSSLTASVSNNGVVCNPTLTASSTGGTGSVAYHWNTNQNTTSITGLTYSTTYIVTATDANSCTASASLYASVMPLTVDSSQASITYPTCVANNGSITVTMNNGTAPYSYAWDSTSATTATISNLSPGVYTVTVTDHNGCTGVGYYYLYPPNQINAYVCTATNPTCGASDGALSACAYGGSGNYSYVWSNSQTTAALSGLSAATYTVSVTDAYGCSTITSYTLKGEAAGFVTHIISTPTACDSTLYTGTASAVVTAGTATAPFAFTWYGGQWYSSQTSVIGTTQTITGLSYGTFVSLQVTDANGCIPASNYDSVYIQYDPACYDHITGYAYDDLNSNCTRETGETGLSGITVSATAASGQQYWASTDSLGYYDITVTPGTYVVRQGYNAYGYCALACTASYVDTFTAIGLASAGNDFGQSGASSSDLGVHMGYQGAAPGGPKNYWVYYYNRGTTPATGTVLNFVHDANLTLVSTNPAYTSYNSTTHAISWNIGTVPVSYWDNAQLVTMVFDIPSTLALGTLTTAHADINPIAGDCNPADNVQDLSDIVSGSHDPNEKEVSPAGNLTESDTVLTYTIRFQNNGNAPASRIVVTDTLSSSVDAGTIEPGASSAKYNFALSGRGILTFTFDGINLPDSVHDEPHSKGFVMYTVHTKKNLPIGTQVKNTAYIYFDINPAVVTNTTVSTRSDFRTGITSVSGDNGMMVTVSPNPVQDKSVIHITGATGSIQFSLTDVRGQKVMDTTTTDKDLTLEAESFAPGMYLYTAKDATGKTRSGKVLITH